MDTNCNCNNRFRFIIRNNNLAYNGGLMTDDKWIKSIAEHFVNRKIVSVKIMSDEEMDNCFGEDCWHARAVAFKLDNGHWFYPSQDDEGNGAGAIFTTMKKLPVVPVMA